jgi:exodeoxyribonuclease-3
MVQIFSWNVNGIRAAAEKGFADWLISAAPEFVCLQETRATPDQIPMELRHPPAYHSFWASAQRPGYSGVAIYSRQKPQQVTLGMGSDRFDIEGRTISADFGHFTLISAYIPSGAGGRSRWYYKMAYVHHLLEYVAGLRAEGKSVILCGDFNIAHTELDLVRPVRVEGFMPEERDWISELIDNGFRDSYRHLNPTRQGAFTWWTMREGFRESNRGWRLDYIFISEDVPLLDAKIHVGVRGSDHCPVSVEVDL